MTLIFILIALGLDFFIGGIERLRNFSWWITFYYWVEKRVAHLKYWDGPVGLICLLSVPILALLILIMLSDHWSWALEGVITLVVLIYCLAPEDLDNRLDQYITASQEGDKDLVDSLTDELINESCINEDDTTESAIIKSAFVEAHQRTFAVIFWFLVLGVIGAFLYRIVCKLEKELNEIHGGFSDSTKELLHILEWPSSRLMNIGLGLAGSLAHAFDNWRHVEALSFKVNNDVLTESGLGALQYLSGVIPDSSKTYWIEELKSLLNRTLIIWLAVLAIMTLSGKLG